MVSPNDLFWTDTPCSLNSELRRLASKFDRIPKGPGVMVNFVALVREHWMQTLVPIGFVIGIYLDRYYDSKLTTYRNKSALYSRELKPGEEVTWK